MLSPFWNRWWRSVRQVRGGIAARTCQPWLEVLERRNLLSTGDLLHTFLSPTSAGSPRFGGSVAAVGTNILVGAPNDDAGATDSGAAYLFDGSTGALLQTFVNPVPGGFAYFGNSVAAVGNKVLVGTVRGGATYLFDGSTGALLQTFFNPTPASTGWFGWSVAAVGNNVLVGAYGDDTGATDAGAVYLFDGTTGALLRTFFDPTPAAGDQFGVSVAAVGNNVLVGAPYDGTAATNAGAAYLFDGATGVLLQTFLNPTPASNDKFGWPVAAVGNNVLVAAYGDDTGATNTGAAYLFDADSGVLLQTFLNPTPEVGDGFGNSVAGVGSNVLVGAHADKAGGNAGAAYLFDASTGVLLETFLNPTPANGDQFGWSVAAVGNNVLVGAVNDDAGATDSGAAYLFESASLVYGVPSINGADSLVLSRQGPSLILSDNGLTVRTDTITGQESVLIVGADKEPDSLTLNFAGGLFAVAGGIEFRAGTGAGDSLLVQGGDHDYQLDDAGLTTSDGLWVKLDGLDRAGLVGGLNNNLLDATGFTGPVTLEGGAGDDVLRGGSANDRLYGGPGDDDLTGQAGTDVLLGGTGIDTLIEAGDFNFRLTNRSLRTTTLLGLLVSNDRLQGIEQAQLTGGAGNNVLNASLFKGAVTLAGGLGGDTLLGGAGDDFLDGGAGMDLARGGRGNDLLDGGDDNDLLFGDAGNDELFGGTGADRLTGGAGLDNLFGEADPDQFSKLDSAAERVDFSILEGDVLV